MPRRGQSKRRSAFLRGRRIAWLLASALPLLATEQEDERHRPPPLAAAEEEEWASPPHSPPGSGGGDGRDDGATADLRPSSAPLHDVGETTANDCRRHEAASFLEFDAFLPSLLPPLTTWWNGNHNHRDSSENHSRPPRQDEHHRRRNSHPPRHLAPSGSWMHPPFVPPWEQLSSSSPYEPDWCRALPDSSPDQQGGRHDNGTATSPQQQQQQRPVRKREDGAPPEADGNDEAQPAGEGGRAANGTRDAVANRTAEDEEEGPPAAPTPEEDVAATAKPPPPEQEEERFVAAVDYASKSAGGLVLDKSPNFQGSSNLLSGDRDRYAIVECSEPAKWVVIGLSEDILVKRVVLAHYERYSSHVKDFALFASTTATGTTAHWRDLGNFSALPGHGEQSFDVPTPAWARYVKFQILSHHGSEHYCTVSQIKVHGSTVLQGFHEQWEEAEVENEGGEAKAAAATAAETTPAATAEPREDADSVSASSNAEAPPGESQSSSGTAGTEGATFAAPTANATTSGASPKAAAENRSGTPEESTTNSTSPGAGFESAAHRNETHACWSVGTESRPYAVPDASFTLQTGKMETRETHLDEWHSRRRTAAATATIDAKETMAVVESAVPANRSEVSSLSLSLSLPLVQQTRTWFEERGWNASGPEIAPLRTSAGGGGGAAAGVGDRHRHKFTTVPAAAEDSTANDTRSAVKEAPRSDTAWGDTRVPLIEDGGSLDHLVFRIPSASCLLQLEASARRVSQARKGGSGGAGSGGGTHAASGGVEPIFKKLTDEIKALQATVGVYDEITREIVACYRRVLADLFAAMEADRVEHDARLRRLEQSIFGGAWRIGFLSLTNYLLSITLRVFDFAMNLCPSGELSTPVIGGCVAGLFAVVAAYIVRLNYLRRSRSPTKGTSTIPERNHSISKGKENRSPSCMSSVTNSPLTPELFIPIKN